MKLLKLISILTILFLSKQVNGERKKVMVLHSYHMGLEWTDSVTKGIEQAFIDCNDDIEVFYEFLDIKRNLSEDYSDHLKSIYEIKLKDIKLDVVITCDNYALDFSLKNRLRLFKSTPIVFCGINNFSDSMVADHKNITGVVESPDLQATINLIIKNHPKVNRLCIINDNKTPTAIQNKKILRSFEHRYKIKFDYWEDYCAHEIEGKLRKLTDKDAVFLLTYNKDKEGLFISYRHLHELVPKNIKQPVYAPWQFYLKPPVVGGKMINGRDQGLIAAKMAIEILKGKEADSIPVIKESLSRFSFTHSMLKKLKIKESSLPVNSLIIGKPVSHIKANKNLIIIGICILLISYIVIAMLLYNIRKRKKAEVVVQEKQRQLEKRLKFKLLNEKIVSLLNSTNDFKLVIDDIISYLSKGYLFSNALILGVDEGGSLSGIIAPRNSDFKNKPEKFYSTALACFQPIVDMAVKGDFYVLNNLNGLNEPGKTFFEHLNIGALGIFPVKIENRVIGVATFAYSTRHFWSNEQNEELTTLISLLANAWERNVQMNKLLSAEKSNMKANLLLEKSSRLASIGVIAAGITHEINQPLNALRVTVDSINIWEKKNKELVPDIITNKLSTLSQGVYRIDKIVSHMRKFWISERQLSKNDTINLVQVIANVHTLVKWQMNEAKIKSLLLLPKEDIYVCASSVQIEQIIINFVVNSIQAFKSSVSSEKEIKIEVVNNDYEAVIVVSDNATGIPPEIGDKLYDPFYTSKSNDKGTGLGLAIVKTLVDKMNGRIRYENNDAGGVSFYIAIDIIKTN